MSKRSRTFQPSDPKGQRPDPDGQPSTPSTSTTPAVGTPAATPAKSTSASSRAEARRRGTAPRPTAQQSFFERYRILIIGGAGVVVVLLALLFVNRSTTQAFQCLTFLTPPPDAAAAAPGGSPAPASSEVPASGEDPASSVAPVVTPGVTSTPATASSAPGSTAPIPGTSPAPSTTPSPAPSATPAPTPLLGFQTSDMGKEHAVQGASISYAYCPPASGRHYNLGGGQAPLARRFFGPNDSVSPPQWIHNLEHGFVVLLYRGEPDEATLDELRTIMDEAEVSDWSLANCGPVNKVIVLRFDDMDPSVNFAAVAWDRVLLQEELDGEQLLTFANQWQDGPQTPERVCS